MAALHSYADIIFYRRGFFFVLLFSSPILSGCRLDVYHTSTRDVALAQIWNAGLNVLHAAR